MDGTERMVLVNHLSHPWGIAVYGPFLYYTDEHYEVIERVDKATGSNKVVFRDNTPDLRGLRVYHRHSKYLSLKHIHSWMNNIFTSIHLYKHMPIHRPMYIHMHANGYYPKYLKNDNVLSMAKCQRPIWHLKGQIDFSVSLFPFFPHHFKLFILLLLHSTR